MGWMEEVGAAAQAVADQVGRSVVRVGGGWRGGSGFVVGDGLVLTNAHNVRAERQVVLFADGHEVEAAVKGMDVDGDICVLAVDTGDAPAVKWADGEPSLGSPVFALTLSGSGGSRVTLGFVSGVARPFRGPRGRRIAGALEHTAPLAPGSSGSALVAPDGRVIGINTNRLGEGFYLAIPVDSALQQRIDALARGETVERPRLGVGLAPAIAARRMRRAVGLPERDGLLVRHVEEGSAADAAGLAQGDLIVAANGQSLAQPDDLYEVLGTVSQRDTLELRVVRGTDERTVAVRFGEAGNMAGGAEPVH